MMKVNGWTDVEQQIYTQELDQLIAETKPAAG